jgi:hypothetical protein
VRWADAFNIRVHPGEQEQLRDSFAQLDQRCREASRDPASLQRTGFGIVSLADTANLHGRFPDPKRTRPFSGTPEEIAVQLHALSDLGVEHMACIVDDGQTPGPLTQYPTLSADGFERFLLAAQALRQLEAST